MYAIPPIMLEQQRLKPTRSAAEDYGSEHPDEFGGVDWAKEPCVHVVLLVTAHVDAYLRALCSRVPHPDRIEVRKCRYTDCQIDAWLGEVGRRLRPRWQELSVNAWGRGRIDQGFGVHVFIWPWSDEAAEGVRRELAPIPVVMGAQGPAMFGGR
ncbi:hypothetical protein [Actinopolymorpha pittospori]|uniref:Uncharacterized protein n=1 Tax=Actinopolymorpha pittospori TaxID=648752 RepID=A0A927MQ16_9ACTN|nr:hypothetical protein [Actinopolymorpha pittospori]MBE1604776.1 hypothetical protein [Actinopolymorpha pittospori]